MAERVQVLMDVNDREASLRPSEAGRAIAQRGRNSTGRSRLLMISIDAPFVVSHHLSLARAAQESGYDVHIAAPVDPLSTRDDEKAVATISKAGLSFHVIPLRRSSTNPLRELGLLRRFSALIDQLSPDLLHCIGMKPVLYGGALARLKRLPAVHAVTGLGSTFMGTGLAAGLRRAALIRAFAFSFGSRHAHVTVENLDDRAVFTRARALDLKRSYLLRGVGADLTLFRPREAHEAGRGGPPVVMFASRLIAAKGVHAFVDVARQIRSKGLFARFVILGERDPENPTCVGADELQRWQSEGVIEYWGHSHDMPNALRQADIFCLPSFYREGVPKVLIEAAASGLAIVTTDMPGCRDVVRHRYNGILVPAHNPEMLESAVMSLLTDAEFREIAGIRSREIAVAEFSQDAFVTASLAVYRAALSEKA